jgi:hypothetical protein
MKTATPTAHPHRASQIPSCLDPSNQESQHRQTNQGFFNSLLEGGTTLTEAFVYSAKIGCLNVDGACASLAAIPARERINAAFRQADMLARVRDWLEPGVPLDIFVGAHIADAELRRSRIAEIGSDALPLAYAREVVDRLEGV